MSKWLARARREIAKPADRPTANTAVRILSAVTAVPQAGESENSTASNGSNGSTPDALFQKFAPLSESELGKLITDTAKAHRRDPLALWRWCDLDLIEALRAGDPADIRAFRFAVGLPTWDGSPPTVPHGIPFPGECTSPVSQKRSRILETGDG